MFEEEKRKLLAAADFFQIAGIAFEFPCEAFAEGLSESTLVEDARSCLLEMGAAEISVEPSLIRLQEACVGASAIDILSRLRKEHSRLFANTKQPVIWVYETMFCYVDDGRSEKPSLFVSPTCLHVEQAMREAGVAKASENKQPADYLPTELQFLSYLCNAAAHELSGGGDSTCARDRLGEFKCMHADRWIAPIMERIGAEAQLSEYRELAALTTEGYRLLGKII